MSNNSLDAIFRPRSIAIVGASDKPGSMTNSRYTVPLRRRFKGPIYPVNPGAKEVLGMVCYPSVTAIPGPVDLAIIGVPARLTPGVIKDCAEKRVKAVHIFTAGFSEDGTELGRRLESEILSIVRAADLPVVGPNCMGIYCPESGLAYRDTFPEQPGPLGVISQSGLNTTRIISMATNRGLYFSKAVSYGNGLGLNECDFLECLAADPKTRIIGLYLEGTRDGKRLRDLLPAVSKCKPVIAVKSAVTDAGMTAAVSHTGALAGNDAVWDALLRQSGVLRVSELEDMVDSAIAFATVPALRGNRVCIIGCGGGAGIMTTDSCIRSELRVPLLSLEIQRQLSALAPSFYVSTRNPIDFPPDFILRPDVFGRVISIVARSGEADILLLGIPVSETEGREETWDRVITAYCDAAVGNNIPVSLVILNTGNPRDEEYACSLRRRVTEAGFPAYPTFRQCVNALSLLARRYLGIR